MDYTYNAISNQHEIPFPTVYDNPFFEDFFFNTAILNITPLWIVPRVSGGWPPFKIIIMVHFIKINHQNKLPQKL